MITGLDGLVLSEKQTAEVFAEFEVDPSALLSQVFGKSCASPLVWEFEANAVYNAAADPSAPHSIYLGGEGRLGRARMGDDGKPIVEVPWSLPAVNPPEPYTYLQALWADPDRFGRVLFGGGHWEGPAVLRESVDYGREPKILKIEGAPVGGLNAILLSPDGSRIVVVVDEWDAKALGVYILGR